MNYDGLLSEFGAPVLLNALLSIYLDRALRHAPEADIRSALEMRSAPSRIAKAQRGEPH